MESENVITTDMGNSTRRGSLFQFTCPENSYQAVNGAYSPLNDAFSDMAGEAAESFMNGANDWMVGEQIFKGPGALRYTDDPTKDGCSIGHASDMTSGLDGGLAEWRLRKGLKAKQVQGQASCPQNWFCTDPNQCRLPAITSRAGGDWQKASLDSWFFYPPSPAGVNAFDYV
jgi:hypothetical protein